MRLRAKTLIISLVGLSLAALGMLGVQAFIHGPYLYSMEDRIAGEKSAQVLRVLEDEFHRLMVDADNWAFWDPTDRFVRGLYNDFIQENLVPEAYEPLGIKTMVFFSADGRVFWSGEHDPDAGTIKAVQDQKNWESLLTEIVKAQGQEPAAGYALFQGEWAAFGMSPIRPISAPDKPSGTLIFLKPMEQSFWDSLSQKSGVTVEFRSAGGMSQTQGYEIHSVEVSDGGNLTAVTLGLPDIKGLTSLELHFVLPRTLEKAGVQVSITSALLNIAILGTLVLFLLFFVQKVLVTPLKTMAQLASTIKDTSNYCLRAEVKTRDEMGSLASGINDLVSEVQRRTAQLEDLASTDALTGLANRRTFDTVLERVWNFSRRERTPVGLIMADVDYFKKYNDLYGHPAGDDCLKQIALKISSAARRPGDILARYGGEELAIILSHTTLEGVQKVAHNIREEVRNLAISHKGSPLGHVTISLGCASLIPKDGASPDDLVKKADQELYISKHEGKDRFSPALQERSAGFSGLA